MRYRFTFLCFSYFFSTSVLCLFPFEKVYPQTVDKIQQTVVSIKQIFYCEDEDYHTDGQRTVWVKSYKLWQPEDWATVQKEAPYVLKFLKQAIEHHRPDVLQQLMPDYYRLHGGLTAFEKDIEKRK